MNVGHLILHPRTKGNKQKRQCPATEKTRCSPNQKRQSTTHSSLYLIKKNALCLYNSQKGQFYWPYQASALQYGRPARVALPGTGAPLASTRELAGPRMPGVLVCMESVPQAACSSTKAAMQMESWQEVTHAVFTSVLGCCTSRGTKTWPLSPSV